MPNLLCCAHRDTGCYRDCSMALLNPPWNWSASHQQTSAAPTAHICLLPGRNTGKHISHLPPTREECREAQLTSASCQGGTQGSTVQCKPTLSTTAGNCTLWSHSQSMLIHTQFHDDIVEPCYNNVQESVGKFCR